MRTTCPSCNETLNLVAEIASVVIEDVRPTQKMGGWDPAPPLEGVPGTHVQTVGELGLCATAVTGPCDPATCGYDDDDCCRR